MNRTDRLLSILLELQDQPWRRATDIAELFDVSTRTIYRDMQALEEAGVPVEGVPGRGYRLFEGYLLPPLLFTTDEAVVLKLGAGYLAGHFDASYRAAAQAAGLKIDGVLPEELRAVVEKLHESIRFVPVNAFDNPAEQALLKALRRALLGPNTVQFRDAERGEALTVNPYTLVHLGRAWHLVGLNHATRRVQHFPLGRMTGLTVTEATFERPAGYKPSDADETQARGLVVRVLFDETVAPWVKDVPSFYVEDTRQQADGLLVTLRVQREAEVLPWLLSWGAHAYVLEPASLRHRLAHEARRIAERYHAETLLM
jgi:predicted DNA-binding transcriptional regulator YafY